MFVSSGAQHTHTHYRRAGLACFTQDELRGCRKGRWKIMKDLFQLRFMQSDSSGVPELNIELELNIISPLCGHLSRVDFTGR